MNIQGLSVLTRTFRFRIQIILITSLSILKNFKNPFTQATHHGGRISLQPKLSRQNRRQRHISKTLTRQCSYTFYYWNSICVSGTSGISANKKNSENVQRKGGSYSGAPLIIQTNPLSSILVYILIQPPIQFLWKTHRQKPRNG